jgi:hypothetical protein
MRSYGLAVATHELSLPSPPLRRDSKRALLHDAAVTIPRPSGWSSILSPNGRCERAAERAASAPSGMLPEIFVSSLSASRQQVTSCPGVAGVHDG